MVRAGLILLLVVTVFLGLVVGMSLPLIPSGTWAETGGTMGAARRGAASVLLGDGTVLVLGGVGSDGSVLASAELLTSGGVFVPSPAMTTPRTGHTATVLGDGRVLVAGGWTIDQTTTSSTEIYDPIARTWSEAGALPESRSTTDTS